MDKETKGIENAESDHDIRDFNRRELRDAFGMVLQDTWLSG